MPATVDIMRWTGAAGAPSQDSHWRPQYPGQCRGLSDQRPAGNPVQIPPVGTTNYSYWVAPG